MHVWEANPVGTFLTQSCVCASAHTRVFLGFFSCVCVCVCWCVHVKADSLYSVGVLMTLHNH